MSDEIKEKDINYILEKELAPDRYCYIHNYIIDLKQEKEDYKFRVEKAIEYIKSLKIFGLRSGKTLFIKILNDLLNILQVDKD